MPATINLVCKKLRASLPASGGTNRYRIRAQGQVAQGWIDAFENMAIFTDFAPDGMCLTTLEGVLPDQAALIGILNILYDLQLKLLRVELLPEKSSKTQPN
ncbi:MAG: hypothetical protein U0X20_20010 [Caldilineaceae bacterium]